MLNTFHFLLERTKSSSETNDILGDLYFQYLIVITIKFSIFICIIIYYFLLLLSLSLLQHLCWWFIKLFQYLKHGNFVMIFNDKFCLKKISKLNWNIRALKIWTFLKIKLKIYPSNYLSTPIGADESHVWFLSRSWFPTQFLYLPMINEWSN